MFDLFPAGNITKGSHYLTTQHVEPVNHFKVIWTQVLSNQRIPR